MAGDVILITAVFAIFVIACLGYSKRKPNPESTGETTDYLDCTIDRQSITSAPNVPVSCEQREEIKAPKTVAYAFVDLETTGLDPENERIIEICVFIVTPNTTSHEGKVTLVNPRRPLTPFIKQLTGITDEMLEREQGEECLHEYFDFIGDRPVYAYNANFDMGFLRAAARRLGRTFNNQSVCILERVKREHPNLRSYRLEDACEAFSVEIDGTAHRAEGDTLRALFLWNAVNNGKQPDPPAVKLDRNAQEYGVYGHYRPDGVPFYVWTAKDGEPTSPSNDYTWAEYVKKQLQGRYEVRCIKGGVTLDHAIALKDKLLAEHAKTVLNPINPHRHIIHANYEQYEKLKNSYAEHRKNGKALESSDLCAAIACYQEALLDLNAYARIVLEEGLFGEVTQEMIRQAHGGEAIKILDRISLLLCKAKRHEEANAIAQDVFATYPHSAESRVAKTVTKRIEKGLKTRTLEASQPVKPA